jgi:hypothetical protein
MAFVPLLECDALAGKLPNRAWPRIRRSGRARRRSLMLALSAATGHYDVGFKALA